MNVELILDRIGIIPGPFRDACREFILSWCADVLIHMNGKRQDDIDCILLQAAFRDAMNDWLAKRSNFKLMDGV